MIKIIFLILIFSSLLFGVGYDGTSGGFGPIDYLKFIPLQDVQTTDATQTVAHTFTLDDNTDVHVTVLCHAKKSDNSKRETFKKSATFYRSGGGASLEGSVVEDFNQAGTTYDMVFDVNSNDWQVKITGLASETVNWKCFCERRTFL